MKALQSLHINKAINAKSHLAQKDCGTIVSESIRKQLASYSITWCASALRSDRLAQPKFIF